MINLPRTDRRPIEEARKTLAEIRKLPTFDGNYNDKEYEDLKRIDQLKQMLKRTRQKYRAGSKYNDTNIDKHQYYFTSTKITTKK